MTQEQQADRDFMTVLFHKVFDLNSRGYYTAWFEYVGHTGDCAVRIIKGQWKHDKKNEVVFEGLLWFCGNKIREMLNRKDMTTEQLLALLDDLIAYRPKKKRGK